MTITNPPPGTYTNTALSGGQYLTGVAPALPQADMSGMWSTSSVGDQYTAWKNSPQYAADMASAQAFLAAKAALPAPVRNTLPTPVVPPIQPSTPTPPITTAPPTNPVATQPPPVTPVTQLPTSPSTNIPPVANNRLSWAPSAQNQARMDRRAMKQARHGTRGDMRTQAGNLMGTPLGMPIAPPQRSTYGMPNSAFLQQLMQPTFSRSNMGPGTMPAPFAPMPQMGMSQMPGRDMPIFPQRLTSPYVTPGTNGISPEQHGQQGGLSPTLMQYLSSLMATFGGIVPQGIFGAPPRLTAAGVPAPATPADPTQPDYTNVPDRG